MASVFDSKFYNPEVFKLAIENIKDANKVELASAFKRNVDASLSSLFPEQVGGAKGTMVIHGNLGGTSLNYDGTTTLVAGSTKNYAQGIVAIGRMFGWTEKDFLSSVGGYSELDAQAYQVALFQDKEVKATGLSILKGVFGKTLSSVALTEVSPDSLNDALVAGVGDLGDDIDTVVMDSYVAGQLAKKKLLDYAKYTDSEGIERVDQKIGYWGGKQVLIDDAVGTNSSASKSVHNVYAFGAKSWTYAELPVKVPYEMARDAFTNGGVDTLIERQRFVLAPYGISYIGSANPSSTDLETADSWELVKDGSGTAIDRKIVSFVGLTITLA